jgi:hypothetical protein
MTINCNLTESDYRAMRRYVMFRYRKVHWYYAVITIFLLVFLWFSNKPETPTAEKIAGLVGVVIVWCILMVVFVVGWKILTRFTGGRFQGSIGPHVFEIGEDRFVESNAEGRKGITLAGLRHVAETDSHFFIIGKTGTGYVIPKRELQSYDALHELQKRVATHGT